MSKVIMCIECGTEAEAVYKKVERLYKGDDFCFELHVELPFCKSCGAQLYDEQLENKIAIEANERIREQRNIITKDEILKILKKYNVSQKFLSKLLGWGEITLTRYINGNYTPSKENSDKLKALENPYFFLKLVNDNFENREDKDEDKKLYLKAQKKVNEELLMFEEQNGKIFRIINWFLSQASEEVPLTHLALQKILYFTQGWGKALTKQWIFQDKCQAWIHGAVYPKVYDTFKEFRYLPLPKVDLQQEFDREEYEILNIVKKYYFDIYSAKTLEKICHEEKPFLNTRKELNALDKCQDEIKQLEIEKYYIDTAKKYNITLEDSSNIRIYLNKLLSMGSV